MDYNRYSFTAVDYAKLAVLSIGASLLVSELFYDSWYGIAGSVGVMLILARMMRQKRMDERKRQLTDEFLDAMQVVTNALLAGSSVENAWKDAQRELLVLHGEQGLMYRELAKMNVGIGMNQTLEELLEDFAARSGIEEIQSLSEIFSFAKRSGGSLVSIIENTVIHIRAKVEVEQEIAVLVASKKLEQKTMNVIPLLILAYLKITSGDYLSVLYGSVFGIVFMTGMLAAYVGAMWLSNRILNIQI